MKIGRLVVENHSEGTVSLIFSFRPYILSYEI